MLYLFKIILNKSFPYLFELIPSLQRTHCFAGCLKTLHCRTELFRYLFLPFNVNEWNKLNADIKNSDSSTIFRKKILALIRPIGNGIYSIYNPVGVRLINWLRLGFSHLREH